MPLFSFIMWLALKPFRRLTTMVNPNSDHFGGTHGSWLGQRQGAHRGRTARQGCRSRAWREAQRAQRWRTAMDDDDDAQVPPERAEARPSSHAPVRRSRWHWKRQPHGRRPADASAGPGSRVRGPMR